MTSQNSIIPTVLLGPKTDLHTGVHWAIVEGLQSDFRFRSPETRHCFVRAGEALASPHKDYCAGEFLDLESGSEIVHSSKWPVIGRSGWVVDHDDIISSTLIGRYALNPNAPLLFKNKQEPFATWMSRRFENMVTAYCHPSCTAVLFWTQATKKWALTLCRKLAPQIEALLEQKSRVIYFVPRPRPRDIVERKWAGEERNVLFCGREFEQKNGAMALRIFSRLIDHTPSAHFIYIGNIPAAARRRHAKLFERMEYYESLSRRDTIPLFERSHVLFHPSRVESYGAVYVEAAASGLAIVTAKGRLMEHVPEIVHERGSCIVDRNSIHGEEEEELAFEYHLAQLTADRPRAESMGWQNYREITDGRLCWRRMCQELGAIYRESGVKAQSGEEGLKLDDLPYSAGGGELRMTLSEIMKDHDYWRAAWDLSRQAIIFDGHDAIS